MQIVIPRGELQVHVAKDNGILRDEITGLGLVIYEFFSCSTNTPSGLSAHKP